MNVIEIDQDLDHMADHQDIVHVIHDHQDMIDIDHHHMTDIDLHEEIETETETEREIEIEIEEETVIEIEIEIDPDILVHPDHRGIDHMIETEEIEIVIMADRETDHTVNHLHQNKQLQIVMITTPIKQQWNKIILH